MFLTNRIKDFEREICAILTQLAHHIHPEIIKKIQKKNHEEFNYFSELFINKIDISHYLFNGSACVYPGVRRYINGNGKKKKYNAEYKAIIDDNEFPRHIWCFLQNGKAYSGPNWKDTKLNQYELAHIFTHKENERYNNFSCACNVVLLPKGTVRPTDNSETIKAVFYNRYIELYGETPLNGQLKPYKNSLPPWYNDLKWNDPVLPNNWSSNIDKLLSHRTKTITNIINKP